jgi:hypothetical protein
MQASKKQFTAKQRRKGVQDSTEIERRWKQHQQTPQVGRVRGRGDYNTTNALTRIRGRGDYRTSLRTAGKFIPKGTFSKGGRMLGTYLGGGLGGDVGALGGNLLSRLTGMGDYTVKQNSVMASATGNGAHDASFSSTGSSVVRVKRRECIGEIVAPGDPPTYAANGDYIAGTTTPSEFETIRYRIQASNEDLFPWGANVAELYQEYKIKGCVFTLESTYSNYSNAGSLGTVCLCTQYNAADRPFDSMNDMINYAFRSTGNPSQTIVHGLECDPSIVGRQEKLEVRNKSNDNYTGAPNNFDFGWLTVATEGLPPAAAGGQIGRLYVTYDIEFSLPRTKSGINSVEERQMASWMPASKGQAYVDQSPTGPWGGTANFPLNSPFMFWDKSYDQAGVYGSANYEAVDVNVTHLLDIGTTAAPKDIVLFEPTIYGANVANFEVPPSQQDEVLAWVCGTTPTAAAQACHINFRYGGWVSITVYCPNIWRGNASGTPPTPEWWVPTFVTEGAADEDVSVTTSLPQAWIDAPPNGAPGNGDNPCTITWTIKFSDSAPQRTISFLGASGDCLATRWFNTTTSSPPLFVAMPTFDIRFLG